MKLISFKIGDAVRYGVVCEEGIVDLHARLGETSATLRDLIEAGRMNKARDICRGADPDYALADVEYLPPILQPEKIVCVGLNYSAAGKAKPDMKYPSIFMRTPGSLVGHGAPIVRPPESPQLDYEGEIAIVIGKGGRRIPETQAISHIAGLTCINEGTIRDWMRHGKFNVTQGKNFDGSGAIGPWIATADEFADFSDVRISTRVNGELRQEDTTANLVFPFSFLIHYISTFSALRPGDIIATGTPKGTGASFDPPVYLMPGDRVDVHIEGVGTLSNTIIDEQP